MTLRSFLYGYINKDLDISLGFYQLNGWATGLLCGLLATIVGFKSVIAFLLVFQILDLYSYYREVK